MNEFLSEIYHTREAIGASTDNSDVEKLAEAQLLDDALRAEGYDIDKLPGETILKLAHQIIGPDSALVKAAAEESAAHESAEAPAEEKKESEEDGEEAEEAEVKAAALAELRAKQASRTEETLEEKVAQADFLGRVMAHSYWNEKNEIEKTAGRKLERTLGGMTVGGVKGGLGGAAAGGALGAGIGALKGGKAGALKGLAAGAMGGYGIGGVGGQIHGGVKSYKDAKREEEKHPDLKKKASAIDMLAEKRAMEWASAHGLLGQSDEEKLATVINQRAVEMLQAQGIDVAAVEAAAQK